MTQWDQHKAEYDSIQEKPTLPLSTRALYKKMERSGLQFGSTFRNLDRVQSGEGSMNCIVKVPDTAATMPANIEYYPSSLLHPTVLDAAFQMLAGASSRTGKRSSEATPLLPNSIQSLYVSANPSLQPGSMLKGYCTFVPQSKVKAHGNSVLWYDDDTQKRLIVMLENLAVTAAPVSAHSRPPRTMLGRLEWVLDVHHSRLPSGICGSVSESLVQARDPDNDSTSSSPPHASNARQPQTPDTIVVEILDRASYVNPNLQVIEIAGTENSATLALEVVRRLVLNLKI